MKKAYKDIFWYLEQVGGSETFHFSTQKEAYEFGHSIRENEGDRIMVDIGSTHVRVKLIEQEARKTRI